jgi:hypothetical protein
VAKKELGKATSELVAGRLPDSREMG